MLYVLDSYSNSRFRIYILENAGDFSVVSETRVDNTSDLYWRREISFDKDYDGARDMFRSLSLQVIGGPAKVNDMIDAYYQRNHNQGR